MNEKTGNFRGFAFIPCPDHVCNELIKLNGIDFLETFIIVEEAASNRSRVNQEATNSVTRRPQVIVNQFPEDKDDILSLVLRLAMDHTPRQCSH